MAWQGFYKFDFNIDCFFNTELYQFHIEQNIYLSLSDKFIIRIVHHITICAKFNYKNVIAWQDYIYSLIVNFFTPRTNFHSLLSATEAVPHSTMPCT